MKKLLALMLALLLTLGCLSGCQDLVSSFGQPTVDLSYPYIGFRLDLPEGTVDLEGYQRLTLEEIDAYDPVYADYGVTVYYDTLTPQQQRVYRILQYAMDQAYPSIFIDERLMEAGAKWFDEILCSLSLDNPMLEQNLSWRSWDAECNFPRNDLFDKTQPTTLHGSIIRIEVFQKGILDKKLEALEIAEKIVQEMPENMADLEKSRYFYQYLGNHVQYYTYDDENILRHYLYEALGEGKTNCDGFANAFSLLCYLSGVTCMEKLYTPVEEDKVGHTWNAVQLDGLWYNVDATASPEVKEEYCTMRRFCFADQHLEYTVDMEERVPECEKNLIEPDVTITKTSQAGKQVKSAWAKVKKTDRNYVVAEFPSGEQKKSVMQKIANSLKKGIHVVHFVTQSGSAIYYIWPK